MESLRWHIVYKQIFFHICAANHCSPSVLLNAMCQMQLLANACGLAPSCAQHVALEGGMQAAVLLGGRECILLTGLLTKEVAFPQLRFVSMALPGAEALLLMRRNIVPHRSEEIPTICTNQCCQGSLEKGKRTYPQCAH